MSVEKKIEKGSKIEKTYITDVSLDRWWATTKRFWDVLVDAVESHFWYLVFEI